MRAASRGQPRNLRICRPLERSNGPAPDRALTIMGGFNFCI